MPSQFHRPSAFQFPRGPPSPPETNSDTVIPGMPIPMIPANISLSGVEFGPVDSGIPIFSPDTPGSRLRKSSSIPYHSSGLRDPKDRPTQSHSKGGKALVIVIPPANLLQERGQSQASHSGPYHRVSQGVIMPLFPSMFGQLTAIAKEFSFPSTSGLCLYLHYVDGDFTLTPRISDESWLTLWNNLSDTHSNERRPLISGKIEFDIDHRLARWYAPWLSSIYREVSDASHPYPHSAPYGHFRGESRTTTADGRFFDEETGEHSVIQQHSAPVIRHAPRKLSLVERFESPLAKSDAKPTPRSLGTPAELFLANTPALSPIRQEDEPKSARQDLNNRVKSWRASAQLSPTPLAATGQTSLEPPNLPNSMLLNTASTSQAEEEILNLDDFSWSVSSDGPQLDDTFSPTLEFYAPSVHIDRRLAGSVCSTLSIQTSSGPSDYDPFSPAFSQFARVPSPDIAHRFYENVPDSPLTATTWGAPLSFPPSPPMVSRVSSPDIAHRLYEYFPDTPKTSTTWGAPLSYPPSPMCLSPVPSLDLGERSKLDEDDGILFFRGRSAPRGSNAGRQLSSITWPHVWPYTSDESSDTQIDAQPSLAGDEQSKEVTNGGLVWRQVWPYNSQSAEEFASQVESSETDLVWRQVWPYNSQPAEEFASQAKSLEADLVWRQVWPYNSQYTTQPKSSTADLVWRQIWPYNSMSVGKRTIEVSAFQQTSAYSTSSVYPYVNIYKSVYPYFDLYPSVHGYVVTHAYEQRTTPKSVEVRLQAEYPAINIYVDVYPYNLGLIYPVVSHHQAEKVDIEVRINESNYHKDNTTHYPHNLYTLYSGIGSEHRKASTQLLDSVPLGNNSILHHYANNYPDNLKTIYPVVSAHIGYPNNLAHIYDDVIPVASTRGNASAYPFFNLYPDVLTKSGNETTCISDMTTSSKRTYANLYSSYPVFNLYPAVYPFFDLYPSATVSVNNGNSSHLANLEVLKVDNMCHYPNFNLYPAVYPNFELYPTVYVGQKSGCNAVNDRSTFAKPSVYPFFNLYPGVYPHLDVYPAAYGSGMKQSTCEVKGEASVYTSVPHLTPTYPFFNLYPGIYPYLDIYPTPYGLEDNDAPKLIPRKASPYAMPKPDIAPMYPSFNLYPGVYPYLDIYPAAYGSRINASCVHVPLVIEDNRVELQSCTLSGAGYPYFTLYPSVYPYFDLYPAAYFDSHPAKSKSARTKKNQIIVHHVSRYPFFNLYPAVYPHFDLYPALPRTTIAPAKIVTRSSSRLTHAELHAMVMMETIGATGSFSYDAFIERETKAIPRATFNHGRQDTRTTINVHNDGLSSEGSIHAFPSSTQSREIQRPTPRISSTLRASGHHSVSTPLKTSHSGEGLSSWQLSRSPNLRVEQPDLSLPLRPSSVTQGHQPARSASLRDSIYPRSSTSPPLRPIPRKRDSLVLQRVKAYDSTGEYGLSSFIDLSDDNGPVVEAVGLAATKDTLSKFPMPPKMPLPPLPLDRSK